MVDASGDARTGPHGDHDLISALTGRQAGMERNVAQSTRRVVLASLGVLKEQKAGRKRIRAVALASTLLIVLGIGPLIWLAVDDLIADGHIGDVRSQLCLWFCIFCTALLAAALVAGWLRRRQLRLVERKRAMCAAEPGSLLRVQTWLGPCEPMRRARYT